MVTAHRVRVLYIMNTYKYYIRNIYVTEGAHAY